MNPLVEFRPAPPREAEPQFSEDIRLIIWDLDDTFWHGTLSEGGYRYVPEHHDLVIEMARRGIMSAICSKNDRAVIQELLTARGLWEYFIFPSIDWTPKAGRIKSLIEQAGLRPATVLFIDDNPNNLNEVRDRVPDINIAMPDFIPLMRQHRQFRGKADPELSRLMQYRVLEQKVNDLGAVGDDNIAFLRKSNIRVYFEYEVENHLDRIIELINRTNQLNFTKQRLPEDMDEARRVLGAFLRNNGTTSGLIRVVDDYGDYGFVGFYAMTEVNQQYTLKHFCFSCRTLNMYVEHFVYDFIGRPALDVQGEVLSDVITHQGAVDWIEALPIDRLDFADGGKQLVKIERIYARGGCDLMALVHYFALNCRNIIGEYNGIKNWQYLRSDHSSFLYYALNGLSAAQARAAAKLAYDADDFTTAFPWRDAPPVVLLSFWADADIPVYRHKESGLELPYWIGGGPEDLISNLEAAARYSDQEAHHERIAVLRAEWEYIGYRPPRQMAARYRYFLRLIPKTTKIFMILANEREAAYFTAPERPRAQNHVEYNDVLRAAARVFENVVLIDPAQFIHGPDEILDLNHFRRDIYFKIYQEMIASL